MTRIEHNVNVNTVPEKQQLKKIQIGQNFQIGEALTQHKPEQAKNNVISSEPYKLYDKINGTLIKYDDGTVMFQYNQKDSKGNAIVCQYNFKNEKALNKQQPSSQILNAKDPKKRTTIDYEYYHNGKLKNKEIYVGKDNKLAREEHYKKDGKIENTKIYNIKTGELSKTQKFTHNKDNSVDIQLYDQNNKLTETQHIQYKSDGKTKISAEVKYPDGAKKSEIQYNENGKIQSKNEYFANGKIKSETTYWDNGVIKDSTQYDEQGKITQKISSEIDGNFGSSRQVGEGDCYLMATINSIRELSGGQELLKSLVKTSTNNNGEKVYTVTLPGAKAAAEGLKTDNQVDKNKIHITGEYTFTEAEMQDILKKAGHGYSLGDGDVILLEAAFEKYRKEVEATLKDNPNLKSKIGIAGVQTGKDTSNILSGGQTEDATFILTGRRSKVYKNYQAKEGLDYTSLQQGEVKVAQIQRIQNEKAAVSEIDGKISNNKKDLNKMLDDIMNDGKDGHIDNIAVAAFFMVHDDGSKSAHAFTLKSVTDDTVTLINPWHPDKELTMSRADFINSCMSINVADTTKPVMTPEDVQLNPNNPHPGSAANQTNNNHQENNNVNQNHPQQQDNNSTIEVRHGDNLWKIAKRKLGAQATSTQIANYINKMMKANPNLKWDKTHSNVMIHPGDSIILP